SSDVCSSDLLVARRRERHGSTGRLASFFRKRHCLSGGALLTMWRCRWSLEAFHAQNARKRRMNLLNSSAWTGLEKNGLVNSRAACVSAPLSPAHSLPTHAFFCSTNPSGLWTRSHATG